MRSIRTPSFLRSWPCRSLGPTFRFSKVPHNLFVSRYDLPVHESPTKFVFCFFKHSASLVFASSTPSHLFELARAHLTVLPNSLSHTRFLCACVEKHIFINQLQNEKR